MSSLNSVPMTKRLFTIRLITITLYCSISSALICGSAAQNKADALWYKTVMVKRVAKPNRRIIQPLPKSQNLPLLTVQIRVLKVLNVSG